MLKFLKMLKSPQNFCLNLEREIFLYKIVRLLTKIK